MTQLQSNKPLNVAVTGALTPMGREVVNLLAERGFPLDEIFAVETGAVSGEQISFGEDDVLDIQKLDSFDFGQAHLIIHAGKPTDAEKLMKLAIGNKARMIDLSGAFMGDAQVPMAVVGINDDVIKQPLMKSVIGVPSSATTIIALALKPLMALVDIKNVTATIFDPAITGGRGAMDEVFNQTKAIFMNQDTQSNYFPKQIAFNAIALVGTERDDGYTSAEHNTVGGINRLYDGVHANVTHVSVPIFTGMGISVSVTGAKEVTAIKAALAMTGQPGIGVIDDNQDIPTPAEVSGEDLIYVARLRGNSKTGLQFWLCADNIRRGQALNAVQVAETLIS